MAAQINAKMTPREISDSIIFDEESEQFMRRVMSRMNLSDRAFERVLKVARTIADLQAAPAELKPHLSEAA
jgi:magnesium chelatase family protein